MSARWQRGGLAIGFAGAVGELYGRLAGRWLAMRNGAPLPEWFERVPSGLLCLADVLCGLSYGASMSRAVGSCCCNGSAWLREPKLQQLARAKRGSVAMCNSYLLLAEI